ncbi:MAG: MFS transporter [Nitrososphaerales archaeon]
MVASDQNSVPVKKEEYSKAYIAFVVILAWAGWSLAAMDFNILSSTLPLTAKDLNFPVSVITELLTIIFAGMFIVLILFGPFFDKYGRQRAFQLTLILTAAATGLTALATNFTEFAILRSLADAFAYAESAAGLVLVSEIIGPKRRGLIYSFVQAGWPTGVAIASFMSVALVPSVGWRGVYAFGVIPIVIVIIARLWVRETGRFEHLDAIRKAAKIKDSTAVQRLESVYTVDVQSAEKFTYKQLFSRDLLRKSVFIFLGDFFWSWGQGPFQIYFTYLLVTYKGVPFGTAATILGLSGLVGVAFYILYGFVGDYIGRREACAITIIISSALYFVYMTASSLLIIEIVYPLAFGIALGWNPPYYVFSAESFPTRARGTAATWVNAAGPVGLAVGVLQFGYYLTIGYPLFWGLLWAGLIPTILSLTILGAPRIKPRMELEQIAV